MGSQMIFRKSKSLNKYLVYLRKRQNATSLRRKMIITVSEAYAGENLEAVKGLCRQFRAWLYERYSDDKAAIDQYYNPIQFESLLEKLPSLHAKPEGTILLATHAGEAAGCVMLSKFDKTICEMKRLFVAPEKRGQGVATALSDALLKAAIASGYTLMRLDTGPYHHEALKLYDQLGFKRREAYYDPGPTWRDRLIFMEREL